MKRGVFQGTSWKGWLKLAIILYCVVGITLYYLQDWLFFHPLPFEKGHKYVLDEPYRELNIPYDDITNLNLLEFTPRNDSAVRGVVLYYHGNAKNISWYARFAGNFTRNHYEVWMIDYPGFGKSTGRFTEERLYDYALQAYRIARKRFRPDQIVIYGKSLGTGIAAQLASIRDCKALIMETPYYSFVSLVSHYMPIFPIRQMIHYHFPTNEFLPKVTAPILILRGSADALIPGSNSRRLIPLLKKGDEFVTIEGGGHNNLSDFPMFHEKLDSVLSR